MHETEPWTVHVGYMLAAPHIRKLILLNSTHAYGYCLTLNEASNKALRHWTASRYRRNEGSNAGDWLTTSENTTEFRFTALEAYVNELQTWLPPLPYLSMFLALSELVEELEEAALTYPVHGSIIIDGLKSQAPLVLA